MLDLQSRAGNQAVSGLLRAEDAASDRMPGAPLDPATRQFMEARLGQDFGGVRIHSDRAAAESARRLDARAYTVGDDIVLGAEAQHESAWRRRRLLAHELTHVVQQRRGGAPPSPDASAPAETQAEAVASAVTRGQAPPPVSHGTAVGVARQRAPGAAHEETGERAPGAAHEETGVRADVDPAPTVRGSWLPLPVRITLLKPPAAGRGGWLTAPSFMIRLDPRVMVAGLLDQVTLGGLVLTNPSLVYSTRTNSFTAAGTVSIPTAYPGWDSPTDIGVQIRSTALGDFKITGGVGPLVADLTVDLTYDAAALRRIRTAVMAGDLGSAAAALPDVERRVGVGFSGRAGIGWPRHMLPLAYARGRGSVDPSGARGFGGVAGVIGLPKGTFHPELAVPAAGLAAGGASIRRGRGATYGYGFAGITSTVSIGDLVTGDLGGAVSPFTYAEVMVVRRTSGGHQFSLKLSAQNPLSAGVQEPGLEQIREAGYARRQAERYAGRPEGAAKREDIDPAVLSHRADLLKRPDQGRAVGAVFTGTFDLFGGR